MWRPLCGPKSKGYLPAPSGYTAGLERHGRAVIPSPWDASLKERKQCQQTALQDVVSAGYRAAYENCGTKQPTPQQKKTTYLSKKILIYWKMSDTTNPHKVVLALQQLLGGISHVPGRRSSFCSRVQRSTAVLPISHHFIFFS